MRSSVAAGRRRSVEFATIDEGPEYRLKSSQHSNMSEFSITIDDLDRNISNLDADSPDHNLRTTSSMEHNSRQRSSQSQGGIVSAIRRLTHSRFSSQSDIPIDQGEIQLPPSNRPVPLGENVGNTVPDRSPRRATFFTRERRSIGTRSSMTHSEIQSEAEGSDIAHGNSREVYCLSDKKIHFLKTLIGHPAWKGITLFFILVLLFGPPIRDIWLPKTADGAVDGILTLAFFVLAFDIIIRCIVDKSYFAWNRNSRGGSFAPCQWRLWSHHSCSRKCCNLHVGSHMFWFDTVALLTIVYKLSYINPVMRNPVSVLVPLNELGFPDAGHHATPMSIDWPLMLTIGRVGLMARFIRTSVLVQISSNVYWGRYFYPSYWMLKLTSKSQRDKSEKKKQAMASERVLASSSKGRGDRNSEYGPFSVSSLGDSRLTSRRFSTSEKEGQLEPLAEESESLPPEENSKHTTITDFFKGFARKTPDAGADSLDGVSPKAQPKSLLFGNNDPKDSRSQVGAAMRELTGQRIATGALLALCMTVICDWHEDDTTQVMTMLTLHGQTASAKFAELSVSTARSSVIPSLFKYTRANETSTIFSGTYDLSNGDVNDLREREILSVDVTRKGSDVYTSGQFDYSQVTTDSARVELVTTILILFIWVLGVASFAGPVMTLVVEPIERMVRLLSMLMKDPLGYQSTPQFQQFKHEGDEIADKYKSMWPKEVLKGMETNFLMSTILRIGSLMRVGFGSAGVEIIRNNLERGRHKDVLFLSKQGSSVSCIFLFCDIRQFTDATECLQEEVFVFTNKIAAVVHSICHSYGGSANKNIGDAFLLTWLLDEAPPEKEEDEDDPFRGSSNNLNLGKSDLYATHNQADKALLSVVKISMALHYDNYFVDGMNEAARNRLLTKLSKRKGPIVQMGFGLHAGKAVQGAIGSQRKLDATYISESVERSEFLESSTKKYGVPLLMSDAFYNLLDSNNRRRCRKLDQLIMLREEDEGLSDPHELLDSGEKMSIYTFDMDIEALWRPIVADDDNSMSGNIETQQRQSFGPSASSLTKRRSHLVRRASFTAREMPSLITSSSVRKDRRSSFIPARDSSKSDMEKAIQAVTEELTERPIRTLVLPSGVRHYNERAWLEPDIKKIRRDYVSNGIIFPKYQEGLKSYCAKDWEHAKQCFEFVLSQRDDGPSRCFLGRIAEHNGVPPRNFVGYTIEDL